MSAQVSGRQHVEAALSDSEASFQAIFDHAALGIAQIGLDKSWMRVNNRFCQMLGYSEAELRTKTLGDITHPDYTEESRAGRRQLLAGEISSHTMEKLYIRKDGTVFWGRLNRSLVRDCDSRPQYIIAVVEDITDRRDVERALRESEQRLILAQNAAHLGVCQWDLTTNVYTFTEEYARLYGLAPDDPPLTLEALRKRTHPDDRERVQAILGAALEQAQAWDIEYRVLWPDGSAHWLHSKGAVFPDVSGRSMGVILDITERKRLERTAEANRKEVQALAASLMTAQEDERRRVSRELHDGMCQELGSLAIEIGRIAAHLPSPEDLPSQLRALQARVVKASVEASNIAYQLRPPELDDLGLPIALRDLCDTLAERAPGMAFELTSDALPQSVPLEVTSCVYRVAQESLYNTVRHSRAKHASVILTWRQGTIELTIADDGDGFDSQSVQGKGGLGLIGMEERARLVNGKLTIMSQPGSGTRIALDVPLPPTCALSS
jgi:PAS domain S-box-containing protein